MSWPAVELGFWFIVAIIVLRRMHIEGDARRQHAEATRRWRQAEATRERAERSARAYVRRQHQAEWRRILGLPPEASLADARAAFHRLAKQHHPDAGGSNDRFIRVKRAWDDAQRSLA
jgi:hypothetical protein